MTRARKQRLKEARKWYPEQGFNDNSHVIKAYRQKFHVDRECAMRELCMLKVLSPEKQKVYEEQLSAKDRRRKEKREARKAAKELERFNPDQDENFFFIAGYTSGGAPYGVTWEEAAEIEMLESMSCIFDDDDEELPFD